MGLNYFKSRKRFDFSPHPFDVGNILGLKWGMATTIFCSKYMGWTEPNLRTITPTT